MRITPPPLVSPHQSPQLDLFSSSAFSVVFCPLSGPVRLKQFIPASIADNNLQSFLSILLPFFLLPIFTSQALTVAGFLLHHHHG
jgi:hypothetical protein